MVKPIIDTFDEVRTLEDMDNLLLQLGSFLVKDKPMLSKWIQGVQNGFSQLLLISRKLAIHTEELETLKEFLTLKIEQLQMRILEVNNEKEDLDAMHSSSSGIKEVLLQQVNELTRNFTEVNSQLLVKSQRVQELEQFEEVEKAKRDQEQQ